jgi:hypothetical protein
MIRLSHAELEHFVITAGLELEYGLNRVTFLVLRGARLLRQPVSSQLEIEVYADPPGGNDPNDLFVMMYKDEDEDGHLEAVPCTSHPHWKYTSNPGGRKGAAFLPPYCNHRYIEGLHFKKRAFRAQGEINRVVRDVDKSGSITYKDILAEGAFGVNIHPGKVSAGCVVIAGGWQSGEWKQVDRWLDTDQKVFPLGIIPGLDLECWEEEEPMHRGKRWRPSLTFGSRNIWVASFQAELKKMRLLINCDGDWGPKTQEAFEKWLIQNKLQPTARLTPILWNLLESRA